MNVKARYRVEVRERTDQGDDVRTLIDRMFGRPLSKEAAEAVVALELLLHPTAYEPHTNVRLVAFDPEAPRAEVQP
jgi:hypothetical protein